MEAPETLRFQLTVHYDGSAFHGWQYQPDQRNVQGELQEALSRLADAPRTVIGSGRTDTGVHAKGQVASVDMPRSWTPDKLRRSLNALLPGDMWIEDVRQARSDFHPRYDAIARTYTYRVGTVEQACSPFHRRWCWALDAPLDASLLSAAAEPIVGERSFEAFAKSGQPERGTRCRVVSAVWTGWELGSLFRITADRYLHHMVRYLVGTMVDVARGRRGLDDMNHLLRGRPAMTTSPPAPPEGLFLTHVEYPDTALVSVPSSPRRDTTAGRK